MNADVALRPGVIGRVRSRQSGLPSGLIGRIFGRAMVRDTADANDRALSLLPLDRPSSTAYSSAQNPPARGSGGLAQSRSPVPVR